MHFYTSININYLPKARVLAKSVKKYCNNAKFSLVFVDDIPEEVNVADEPFDEIVLVDQLGIDVPNLKLWIYQHTVVELCTAVKGPALVKFLSEGSEKVVYLDPDITVFDDLECLSRLLDEHDIIVTPHQTIPEKDKQDIINNEICSLKHGIYNFGFYAVKNSEKGLRYAKWWRDRLIDFCYDDIPNGIFTDQRWGDLAPAMFEGVFIWKDPGCNVSTWNLTNRQITKQGNIYYVNGSKLKFYHFSGFDSGAQKIMLDLYAKDNPYLYELRNWYVERQDEEEQKKYGNGYGKSQYNYYDNGELVKKEERQMMRRRMDLLEYFKDVNPYVVNQERSYYLWYQHEMSLEEQAPKITLKVSEYEESINKIKFLENKNEILENKNEILESEKHNEIKRGEELLGQVLERDDYIKELQKNIYDLDSKINTILNSRTWRVHTKIAKLLGR